MKFCTLVQSNHLIIKKMQDGEETVYLIWDIHIMTYHQLNMRLKFNICFNQKESKTFGSS